MADEVVIGKLLAQIGADVSDLKKAQKESKKSFEDVESNASKMASAVIARFSVIAGAILSAKAVLDTFNERVKDVLAIAKLSEASGVAAKSLTQLKYAAEQLDVSFDVITTTASQFNQKLIEISKSPTSDGALALKALGVSLYETNGKFKDFSTLLENVGDKLKNYQNGANKTSLAVAIFGESASSLIPLLNQGADGIAKMRKESDELGATFSQDTVVKVQSFHKAVKQLNTILASFSDDIIGTILPSITSLVEMLTNGTKGFKKIMGDLFIMFQQIRFDALGDDLNNTSSAIANLAKQKDILVSKLQDLQSQMLKGTITTKEFDKAYNDTSDQLRAVTKSMETELERQQQIAKAREDILKTYGNGGTYTEPTTAGSGETDKGNVKPPAPDLSELQRQLEKARADLDVFLNTYFGERPWVKDWNILLNTTSFAEAQQKIDKLTKEGVLKATEATKIKQQLARTEQQSILNTASVAASTLTTVFGKSKAAAIASALINTSVGVTKALAEVPWPYNWIQAGLIAATGAAQVASIRSTSQSGGTTPSAVSSGAGAASSSASADTGNAGPANALTIQGVDRAAFYSGDVVARLIENINDAVKNGATLISTENVAV